MALGSAKSDLINRIVQVYPSLPPKRKLVADMILSDYKKVFLSSAKEIAQECGVSEPTIARFAMDLGFAGFAEFVQYLKGLLHIELTGVERMVKASQADPGSEEGHTLARYCQNTVDGCNKLMRSISEQELRVLAKTISRAEDVVVVGNRASSSVAQFFAYVLKKIRERVYLDTVISWELRDLLALKRESILMVAIAFPRYPQCVVDVLEFARRFGCRILGVSDTPQSPIILGSDLHAVVDVEGISFIDPFASVMTFLEALLHEIAFVDKKATLARLEALEKGMRANNEFYSVEGAARKDPGGGDEENPLGVHFYQARKFGRAAMEDK